MGDLLNVEVIDMKNTGFGTIFLLVLNFSGRSHVAALGKQVLY